MKDVIRWIIDNLLWIIAVIITLVTTYYFYRKSLKIKKPMFSKISFNLIENSLSSLDDLRIEFKNKTVNNLTITNFAFWNHGNDTIRNVDIPTNEPLVIKSIDEFEILDARIKCFNNKANNIIVTIINTQTIQLSFEYLDQYDGAIIQIIHTGHNSESIKIEGQIIGSKKITEIQSFHTEGNKGKNIIKSSFLDIAASAMGAAIVAAIAALLKLIREPNNIIFFDFFIVFLLSSSALITILIYLRNKKIIPKGLKELFSKFD